MTSSQHRRRGATAKDLAVFVAQVATLYVVLAVMVAALYLWGSR